MHGTIVKTNFRLLALALC